MDFKISEKSVRVRRDIYIRLLHNMNFGKEFEINVINTNQIVHSMPELIQINGDILRG